MDVNQLLAENSRRMAEIAAPYNPLAGQETPGRISNDFPYWAAKYAYIKCKGGGDDVLFKLNRPQRRLVAALEEMRTNNVPIRLVLLKARQWGASTCIQLYMAWMQLTRRTGLNSLIIAHQRIATDEIKDMLDRMLSQYPGEMLETDDADEDGGSRKKSSKKNPGLRNVGASGATFRIEARNAKIKIGTAERPDSCRGGDYNLVHCSEVALWPSSRLNSPARLMRSATSGVLYGPDTMIVLESTANGTGNFFHSEYEAARRGDSQFKALFVPWYEIEQYSLPFASGQEREDFARSLIEGRESEQPLSDRRQPGAYLWWLWTKGATLEAIHWYVAERAKYSDHGQMASEYPSDDVEAFVHSGASVFDRDRVEEMRAGCIVPPIRGEISGAAAWGPGSLAGLHFTASENGALCIWKDVEYYEDLRVTNRYLVVVDIGGRAATSDWSVIAVFDREPMRSGGAPEIAAQWRGHVDFDLLAWNAARIAAYYDNALLVIESNTIETSEYDRAVDGDQSYSLLNNLSEHYCNLYERRAPEDEIARGRPVKYGFHTNRNTKPMIISTLVQCVREGLYVEHDEKCLDEYLAYERRPNGSYGALPGHNDDILMTRAIGLHICFNEMDRPRGIPVIPRLYGEGKNDRRLPLSPAIF